MSINQHNPSDHYWTVGGDEAQVYSSARSTTVPSSDPVYQAWLTSGGELTRIDSMDSLVSVLRAANVPPYHSVRKSTIIARLTDAQLAAAITAMSVRQQEKWRAPDRPEVNADDPDANAIVRAVGADPAAVLAPE